MERDFIRLSFRKVLASLSTVTFRMASTLELVVFVCASPFDAVIRSRTRIRILDEVILFCFLVKESYESTTKWPMNGEFLVVNLKTIYQMI